MTRACLVVHGHGKPLQHFEGVALKRGLCGIGKLERVVVFIGHHDAHDRTDGGCGGDNGDEHER